MVQNRAQKERQRKKGKVLNEQPSMLLARLLLPQRVENRRTNQKKADRKNALNLV